MVIRIKAFTKQETNQGKISHYYDNTSSVKLIEIHEIKITLLPNINKYNLETKF